MMVLITQFMQLFFELFGDSHLHQSGILYVFVLCLLCFNVCLFFWGGFDSFCLSVTWVSVV